MQYRIIQRNKNDDTFIPLTIWFDDKEYAEERLKDYWSDKPQYRYELESKE